MLKDLEQLIMPPLFIYLHGQQPGQVDFSDGFNRGFVLHAAPLGLHLVQLVCWPHQVEHFIILQQGTSCSRQHGEYGLDMQKCVQYGYLYKTNTYTAH